MCPPPPGPPRPLRGGGGALRARRCIGAASTATSEASRPSLPCCRGRDRLDGSDGSRHPARVRAARLRKRTSVPVPPPGTLLAETAGDRPARTADRVLMDQRRILLMLPALAAPLLVRGARGLASPEPAKPGPAASLAPAPTRVPAKVANVPVPP